MKPRDMYGQIIETGDYIHYPISHSSGAQIRTAKVLDAYKKKNHLDDEVYYLTINALVDGSLRKLTLKNISKCTVIPKLYIQNHSEYSKLMHMK